MYGYTYASNADPPMNLRFALLAMLAAGPSTGYDLARTFSHTVGFVWNAPHSQIYPELKRMEQAGLVQAEEAEAEGRRRRLYRITDAGRHELRRMAGEVVPLQPERDPVRLRAAYMEFARPEAALAQLESHIAHYTEWLGVWNAMLGALHERDEPQLQRRLRAMPEEQHDVIVAAKIFAYEGLVARAEMEIAWAKRGIELVREHAFALGIEPERSEPHG
jgi:PadR family transcriptional regulator, regulatory protein AphA